MSVPPEKIREALGQQDREGIPNFSWKLTNSGITDLVKLVIPPNNVLPVIFVPGIMGSNLKSKQGEMIWRLDKGLLGLPTSLATKWIWRSAGTRQKALHPDRVDVDSEGAIPDKRMGSISEVADYRRRGWGEVGEDSYHGFLLWLEETLNTTNNPALWRDFTYTSVSAALKQGEQAPVPKLYPGISMGMRGLTGAAEKGGFAQPVLSNDLLKRAKFRMPVYACGYNWLASNEKAAQRLQEKITQIIAENNRNGGKCEQVIVVTHSMGGLVTRRCAMLSGMQEKIAGVVHGVMPTVGAAVAYRRCKVGMKEEDRIAGLIIGSTGQEVTAVFAQAPGALQLLPTIEYRANWLKVLDSNGKAINIQPVNDPCDDIYLRQDRWWGLVREEWLSPIGGASIEWNKYKKNIRSAQLFHTDISKKYHTYTYIYYGVEQEFPSFETVQWKIKSGLRPDHGPAPAPSRVSRMDFSEVRDMGSNPSYIGGQMEVPSSMGMGMGVGIPARPYQTSYWELHCDMQDGGGDGTVPASSGRAPLEEGGANIRQQFRLSGFNHEGAFRNANARQASLYGLMKIAAEAKMPA